MNTNQKSKLDDYVEMLFDDIQDNHTSAALWLHANEGPDVTQALALSLTPRDYDDEDLENLINT